MENTEVINYDNWLDKFKPIDNPFTGEDTYLFQEETEEEKEFIKDRVGTRTIWTRIFGDNKSIFIIEGRHLINRHGYFITEVPYEEGKHYEVIVDEGYQDITQEDIKNLSQLVNITSSKEYSEDLEKNIESLNKTIKYLQYVEKKPN